MNRGQKIVTIIVVVWWFVGGFFSIASTSSDFGSALDCLTNFLTTGLYITIPMSIVWYMLKSK